MQVSRFAEAARHMSPGETEGVHSLLLQHRITGWAGPFSVGICHYLAGAGIEVDAAPGFAAYVVLAGRVEAGGPGSPEVLEPMDSAAVGPGERLSLRNPANSVATVLVVESIPPG